jgi:hypothetical protein
LSAFITHSYFDAPLGTDFETIFTLDTYSHILPDTQKDLAKKFDLAMKKLESKRKGFKSL